MPAASVSGSAVANAITIPVPARSARPTASTTRRPKRSLAQPDTNCAASEPRKIALIRRPMTDRLAPVRAESAGSTGPIAAMRNPAEKKIAQSTARARPGCAGAGAAAAVRAHVAGPKTASWTPCRSARIASALAPVATRLVSSTT